MNKLTYFIICLIPIATSCNTLPQLYNAAEEIADDNAIKIEIQKEGLQKDINIKINLELTHEKS